MIWKGDLKSPTDEITEVIYDGEDISTKLLQEISKTKEQIDICIKNTNNPPISFTIELLIKAIDKIKRSRKINSRCIIDNSKRNIDYIKKLISVVDEVRYSDLIEDNFFINETTYANIATIQRTESKQQQKSLPLLIVNNVNSFVVQQRHFFNLLWDKSTISEYKKIKDIEEEEEKEEISKTITKNKPIKTQVLQDQQEIFNALVNFYKTSNEIKFYAPVESIKLIDIYFINLHQEILERFRKGNHKGIKWITSLNNKKDIELVTSYIDKGIEIRHVNDLFSNSFALSDDTFLYTIENIKEGKMATNMLKSTDDSYVNYFNIVFENMWKKGIDINNRIKDIEKGYYINVETIPNPIESLKFAKQLLENVKEEILVILASSSTFFRMETNIGFGNLEKLTHHGVKVKILIPWDNENKEKIDSIKIKYPDIEFRLLQSRTDSYIGITIIDTQRVLIQEVKDDTKSKYIESVGMTIFIEGKTTALSYASIFDNLWRQTELYEEIKKAYEKLQIHEKMLKEFTEIAAHELRTPIQPILGFTQHLRDKVTDKEQADYLEIIGRNTKRLKKLTEDILEISKIENNLFNLNKEQFDIKEFIRNLVNTYKKQVETKNIEFEFVDFCNKDSLFIYADKNKISQVLSNLISNSIKFIPEEKEIGNITITIEKKAQDKDDKNGGNAANFDNQESAIITVKDNGIGIDKDILPILFKKFSSKSFQGTGLGLYISKRIIEAHNGKIWIQNNEDGKEGATFSFSIPL